jgi:hypothetical protein
MRDSDIYITSFSAWRFSLISFITSLSLLSIHSRFTVWMMDMAWHGISMACFQLGKRAGQIYVHAFTYLRMNFHDGNGLW